MKNRFYSTNLSHEIHMSLQQDICHYNCLLQLNEGFCVTSVEMNIRTDGFEKEPYHFCDINDGYTDVSQSFTITVIDSPKVIADTATNITSTRCHGSAHNGKDIKGHATKIQEPWYLSSIS